MIKTLFKVTSLLISPIALSLFCSRALANATFVNLSDEDMYVVTQSFHERSTRPSFTPDQFCYRGWYTVEALGGSYTLPSGVRAAYVESGGSPITWTRPEHGGFGIVQNGEAFNVCLEQDNYQSDLQRFLNMDSAFEEVQFHEYGNGVYEYGDTLDLRSQDCSFGRYASRDAKLHADTCHIPGHIIRHRRTRYHARSDRNLRTSITNDGTALFLTVETEGFKEGWDGTRTPGYFEATYRVWYVSPR